MTCGFTEWALTGSNRRLPPCKGGTVERCMMLGFAFWLVNHPF